MEITQDENRGHLSEKSALTSSPGQPQNNHSTKDLMPTNKDLFCSAIANAAGTSEASVLEIWDSHILRELGNKISRNWEEEITQEEYDNQLETFKAEASGIRSWLGEGMMAYIQRRN